MTEENDMNEMLQNEEGDDSCKGVKMDNHLYCC